MGSLPKGRNPKYRRILRSFLFFENKRKSFFLLGQKAVFYIWHSDGILSTLMGEEVIGDFLLATFRQKNRIPISKLLRFDHLQDVEVNRGAPPWEALGDITRILNAGDHDGAFGHGRDFETSWFERKHFPAFASRSLWGDDDGGFLFLASPGGFDDGFEPLKVIFSVNGDVACSFKPFSSNEDLFVLRFCHAKHMTVAESRQ